MIDERLVHTVDYWKDIDMSSLENYTWKTWEKNTNNPTRLSRMPYTHRRPQWEEDTPAICKEADTKSREIFKKINPNCEIVEIEKCIIQKVFKGNTLEQSNMHRDSPLEDRWTVLWYIVGDGNTTFYSALDLNTLTKEVEFKNGTAVVFPSQLWHAPGFPIEAEHRIIINYVYHVKNLIDQEIPRAKCTCGQSQEFPYCDLTHNTYYNLR